MNSVNLPRWGLKPSSNIYFKRMAMCKFTPLGFETFILGCFVALNVRVNLPRWGLKLKIKHSAATADVV